MTVQPLRFAAPPAPAAAELLRRFDAVPGRDAALREALATLERLDRQHGAEAPLALEGLEDLVAGLARELAVLGDPQLVLGVALWALAHGVALAAPEPVVNALAQRSNAAREREEIAAVLALMHGVIEHVRPRMAADLERSNPERPWRVLHANLAITAIRTEDPRLMARALDALEAALPEECAGFYGEALALALAPGVAPAVREALEERHRKWTRG